MKRLLILIAALALTLGAFTSYASAMTSQPVAQDDEAKKAHDALYKEWYAANVTEKNYAKAAQLAKQYIEKYPSGQYAAYMTQWYGSLPILRVRFKAAADEKNKEQMIEVGKMIIANKDAQEQEKFEYLWFLGADLIQNEVFASTPNYSHAAVVMEFTPQIITMVKAGKKPAAITPDKWKQNTVVAYLNQALGAIEENNKNNDKALAYYSEALASDPSNIAASFACGKIHYNVKYPALAEEFRKFTDAEQIAASENKPDAKPEAKAAYDRLVKETDAVLECWGRYLAQTAGQDNPTRQQVEKAVKDLYDYRYKSMDGYDKFIEKFKTGGTTATPATPPAQSSQTTAKPPSI